MVAQQLTPGDAVAEQARQLAEAHAVEDALRQQLEEASNLAYRKTVHACAVAARKFSPCLTDDTASDVQHLRMQVDSMPMADWASGKDGPSPIRWRRTSCVRSCSMPRHTAPRPARPSERRSSHKRRRLACVLTPWQPPQRKVSHVLTCCSRTEAADTACVL